MYVRLNRAWMARCECATDGCARELRETVPAKRSPPGALGGDVLDITMRAIQAELDGLSARQRIIAQNLANADTPGYLAGRVDFEDSLRSALDGGVPEQTQVTTRMSLDPTNVNGNNVQVDDENISMIDTGLRYQMATEAMNAKFRILRESMRTS
jgi:flagellar basal-body rod protein FlgB